VTPPRRRYPTDLTDFSGLAVLGQLAVGNGADQKSSASWPLMTALHRPPKGIGSHDRVTQATFDANNPSQDSFWAARVLSTSATNWA
jgi:hypothetical protein